MNNWWTAHSGAILAFIGAGGALLTSLDPGLAAQTEGWAQTGLVFVGVAGAVLHAYLRTPNK